MRVACVISHATFAALAKPGQWSMSPRSLSTVFGMPMKRLSRLRSAAQAVMAATVDMEPLPPM